MPDPISNVSAVAGSSTSGASSSDYAEPRPIQTKGVSAEVSAEDDDIVGEALASVLISAIVPIGTALMAFQNGELDRVRAQTEAKLKEAQQEED